LFIDPCSKEIGFFITIELFTVRISNHWPVTAKTIIKPKNEGDIAVSSSWNVSEDLTGCVQVFIEWLPNEFHWFLSCSFFKVLEIKSWEEPSVKPHISKQSWISIRMAKGINVPSDSRSNPEFLLKPVVSKVHVVYYVFIMCASFIVHTPACIDNFQTTLLN
jgi:hypothetical protein